MPVLSTLLSSLFYRFSRQSLSTPTLVSPLLSLPISPSLILLSPFRIISAPVLAPPLASHNSFVLYPSLLPVHTLVCPHFPACPSITPINLSIVSHESNQSDFNFNLFHPCLLPQLFSLLPDDVLTFSLQLMGLNRAAIYPNIYLNLLYAYCLHTSSHSTCK